MRDCGFSAWLTAPVDGSGSGSRSMIVRRDGDGSGFMSGVGFGAVAADISLFVLVLDSCSAGGTSDSTSDIGSSTISARTSIVESPGIILISVDIGSGEGGITSLEEKAVSSSSSKCLLVHTDCDLCSGPAGPVLSDDGVVSGAFSWPGNSA